MKASEVVSTARDILAQGWCKRRLQDYNGAFCALGALAQAELQLAGSHSFLPEGDAAFMALRDRAKELGYADVVDYNNAPETTHEDVLNWFDKTLIGLEEKGL